MTKEHKGKIIPIDLKWQDASELPTLYANHMYMNHSGGEFYVIFGEAQLPIMINPTPEDIENLKDIKIKPVVKLVFTPQSMTAIVNAMIENIQKFQAKQEWKKCLDESTT